MKTTITHKPTTGSRANSLDCSAMRFGYEWNIVKMGGAQG